MGTLTYVEDDLFNSDAKVIAHGVNCQGGFGSGVAGQIARRNPEIKRAYLRWFDQGKWAPGEVQFVLANDGKVFANMATQDTFGPRGQHVIYEAVEECVTKLVSFAKKNGYTVAMPRIGAGLGGGDWAKIEEILKRAVENSDVDIEVYVADK